MEEMRVEGEQSVIIPAWKVKGVMGVVLVMTAMNGYDVSNLANCQASIYEALGHIKILPWIGMGYSAGMVALMPFFGSLTYLFDFKILFIISSVIWITGVALSGAATSMEAVIVGRVLSGIGGGGLTQVNFTYVSMLAGSAHSKMIGLMGMSFAVGLISGPIVGGALANAPHATWRWAVFIALLIFGTTLPVAAICYPSHTIRDTKTTPMLSVLKTIDWIGVALHPAVVILLYVALTFSGTIYAWNSASSISLWVVWGILFLTYVTQQWFCLFTDPKRRILRIDLLGHHVVGLTTLATLTAGVAYSVSLYYLPLLYAFSRGLSPIDSAVRLLPLIGTFIFVVILSGAMLPVIKTYALIYIMSGALMLISAVLMATQVPQYTPIFEMKKANYDA